MALLSMDLCRNFCWSPGAKIHICFAEAGHHFPIKFVKCPLCTHGLGLGPRCKIRGLEDESGFAPPTMGYTPGLVDQVGQAQAVHQCKAGGCRGWVGWLNRMGRSFSYMAGSSGDDNIC